MFIRFHNYIISFKKLSILPRIVSWVSLRNFPSSSIDFVGGQHVIFLSISIRMPLRISNWPEFQSHSFNEVYLESIRGETCVLIFVLHCDDVTLIINVLRMFLWKNKQSISIVVIHALKLNLISSPSSAYFRFVEALKNIRLRWGR